MEEKLKLIAQALDADEKLLQPEVLLGSLEEWDSMGTIAIISMLDKNYKIQLKANEISSLRTVQDIMNFMQDK